MFITASAYSEEDNAVVHAKEKTATLHITADSMVADSEADYAEFNGNVRATQENLIIMAKRIRIYFKGDQNQDQRLVADEASIKKIVANDDVKIEFDDRIAVAKEAVYLTDEKVLILSGEGSRITMGNDAISGTTITFYREDGRVKVEGSADKRVEAIFFTNSENE